MALNIISLAAFGIVFYMMFAITGDHYSTLMGAVVGSGVRRHREAVIIVAIFATMGPFSLVPRFPRR